MADFTLYNCTEKNNVEKSFKNSMECNAHCKKTNRSIKIKVNEKSNKVQIDLFENGNFIVSSLLENTENVIYNDRLLETGDRLEILDRDNWTYKSGLHTNPKIAGYRVTKLRDGKYFSNGYFIKNEYWKSDNDPLNDCGKLE